MIQNIEAEYQDTIYRIQNTGYRIKDTEHRGRISGYQIQNTRKRICKGYRTYRQNISIPDTEYRIQDTEYRIQDKEYRIQDADTGYQLFHVFNMGMNDFQNTNFERDKDKIQRFVFTIQKNILISSSRYPYIVNMLLK